MIVLLQNVRILDPQSPHHGKRADVVVENGMIQSIGKSDVKADRVISGSGLTVSPGWFDVQVNFCDPGFEHRETLTSGAAAAASGGFTGVLVMPSTQPPVHTKAEVEYILRKGQNELVDIFPAGTMSHKREGKEMSEMYDMHLAGALAFTDDDHAHIDSGLLLRALQYTRQFDRIIMTRSDEKSVSQGGHMNEGPQSTRLGIKGIPALAEELAVARNIQLAEYAGSPIHLASISTAGSVKLVREAKQKGLPVTCSVSAANLIWDETVLEEFDTNFKVHPPLRDAADVKALREALADGTIDVITSDHRPEDEESKKLEFDLAQFGMIGLESLYGLVHTHLSSLSEERFIDAVALRPRRLLGLEIPCVKEGMKANITVFDTDAEWTFENKNIRSLSQNTSVTGMKLKGKVLGVCNKAQWHFND